MSFEAAPYKELVLFAGEDAGGALALAPVIKRMLADDNYWLKIIGHGTAQKVWRRENIDSEPFEAFPPGARAGRADSILCDRPASILVTGTSWQGDDIEKHLITAARNRSIPTISVLDFWSNYVERFSGINPEEHLQYLPDTLAVMDEYAASKLVEKGVPRGILCITGNPHLDNLAMWLPNNTYEAKQRICELTGVRLDTRIILFVSQGIASLYGTDLGFTEETALVGLIDASQKQETNWNIVVKLHPNEAVNKYSSYEANGDVVVLRQELDSRWLVYGADIVVGMRSTMLVEAAYLRKRAISYQPGLIGTDPLFTNNLGATYAAYNTEELARAISEAVSTDSQLWESVSMSQEKITLVKNAATNVVELIYRKMLGQ